MNPFLMFKTHSGSDESLQTSVMVLLGKIDTLFIDFILAGNFTPIRAIKNVKLILNSEQSKSKVLDFKGFLLTYRLIQILQGFWSRFGRMLDYYFHLPLEHFQTGIIRIILLKRKYIWVILIVLYYDITKSF